MKKVYTANNVTAGSLATNNMASNSMPINRHTLWIVLVVTALLAALLAPAAVQANSTHHWNHYQEGVRLYEQGRYAQAIEQLKMAVAQSEQAGYLRKLAEAYEADKQFQLAADTYYREAAIHQKIGEKNGDLNTYFAVLAKADALHTEIEFYAEEAVRTLPVGPLGKFEPESGAYIGGFIENDRGVSSLGAGKYEAFNTLAGKTQSLYFNYHRYGSDFPSAWARSIKAAGGAIQLAVQPESGLAAIKDDAYLRSFARAAKAADVPIFLRFASEMNGNWVSWHGNPAQYIAKFRLVAQVMKEEAPNVAMVWSPAANPKHTIHAYYPGDAWVDWVGLSIYSVKFFNGNAATPADHVNPLDSLAYVYDAYADRKPIMISEYGATHFSKAGNQDTTRFAITKMNMLYHGAKLKYPRLKVFQWFSLNTLTDSHSAERSLNNFSLTENERLMEAYKKVISDPYYLTQVHGHGDKVDRPLASSISRLENRTVKGKATGYVWIKTYDPYISKAEIRVNGQLVASPTQYPFSFPIDPDKLDSGEHKVEVTVYDSAGRVAARRATAFRMGEPISGLQEQQMKLYMNDPFVYRQAGREPLAAAPYTAQGRTLVPIRLISESLGASVAWNQAARTITITGENNMVLTVGSSRVMVNGQAVTIEAPPEVKSGITFVPLRFINEQLGGQTKYSASEQSVTIQM